MCGLVGILSGSDKSSIDYNLRCLSLMNETIIHRGPDDSGVWKDSDNGVYLGHRRLAILDLSSAGHQPMSSQSRRYHMAFNGEIYNHIEIRNEIEKRVNGCKWLGNSDTETLLASLDYFGLNKTIEISQGMFAIALWDSYLKKLFLIRDRFGEKPLYYSVSKQHSKNILFASDLSGILAHPEFSKEIDRRSLDGFLKCGYLTRHQSIYEGVSKVLPGQIVEISPADHSLRLTQYWDSTTVAMKSKENIYKGTLTEAIEELNRMLLAKVKKQMLSDVPLGAFLSGGIDSSLIASLMQENSSKPIRTFTIAFDEVGWDESAYAKQISSSLGTEHTEYKVTSREALEVIPKLNSIFSEPFADVSQIPTFLVSEMAKKEVTVALTGDAGDELFGGYERYRFTNLAWEKLSLFPLPFRKKIACFLKKIPPARINSVFAILNGILNEKLPLKAMGDRLIKGFQLIDSSNVMELYDRYVGLWNKEERLVLGAIQKNEAPQVDLISKYHISQIESMMLADTHKYLSDDILVKVDRAAMAASLETRVPFLDPDVYKFAWSLPEDMKIDKTGGKFILRKMLATYCDPSLFDRPKMGFGVPIGSWLRGPLRGWAEELLGEDKLKQQGYLNIEPVRKCWNEHLEGGRNFPNQLWAVLMFQAWLNR